MLSKANDRKSAFENSGGGKFLNDLETLNKALHADKKLQRLASSTASSRSKSVGKSNLPDSRVKPGDVKNNGKDSFEKEKRSLWSWKGLKALTQVRNRRFSCCFSLIIHSIEGLPVFFDDVSLVVYWKRRDDELMTRPIRVHQGVAEFEEQLTHRCSVYGSRSGPHHSAKYEAKHFLLYASVCDAPDLDLGKHRIDLTRLLPLTLEDLEEEKSSGKWTTSFKLSGKAKGAMVNVSFGYVVIGNNGTGPASNSYVPEIQDWQQNSRTTKSLSHFDEMDELSIRHTRSLPSRSSSSNRSAEDIKDLHEVLPISRSELSDSVNILYQKLDEEISDALVGNKLSPDPSLIDDHKMGSFTTPDAAEKISDTECEINEFSVIEKGVEEFAEEEEVKHEDDSSKVTQVHGGGLETVNTIEFPVDENAPLHPRAVEIASHKGELSVSNCNYKAAESDTCTKESLMKELESALICASDLVNEGFDSQEDESYAFHPTNSMDDYNNSRERRKGKSLSLDDVSKLVASDFFDMLGIEHSPVGLSSESEPESPRERLLRQFEKDSLANGGLLNFNIDNDPNEQFFDAHSESIWGTISEDLHHSQSQMCEGFDNISMVETDAFRNQTKASRLEDLETEALMREWGFNEKAFQHSPPSASGGFGSPINLLPEDPQLLPPIAEGLGPFLQTKNGGFLRSMNPTLFQNSKTGGGLIMQVSSPVVVPAEMGSGVMEILQGLASIGIEKLSMQASKLMPLEDITGKTMQQIAWEALPSLDGPERQALPQHESEIMQYIPNEKTSVKGISSSRKSSKLDTVKGDAEYVSLEDLAPLAMDKIEALSIEGLRIQSGLSDEDAPSNISSQSIGEFSALKGKTGHADGSMGLDGTGGLKLLDVKDSGEAVDGLMGLALTLDEWMKLDSGEIDDDDLVSERTSKILAAHHATSLDMFRGRSKGEKRRGKGRKYGLLGNNFTVALMVQLRDPLRDYEPVGTPMLALIQVERLFVPPKPKFYSTVSVLRNSSEEEEEETKVGKKEDILEQPKEDTIAEELVPQFKITEVHVAGLKTEPGKKKLWGSTNQQQSGSRWLLANGMGKKNKHPMLKSKTVAKSSSSAAPMTKPTSQPGDALWSVSSPVQGAGAKWKEHVAQKRHIRNPNVVFS
ncbi:protein PLASTID MOVEMENT IMPAIRED 1-RELATED 1 [Henckelia pumila]|uniref:protein PLASTID MOVEMENT IMPAIRED 1-RELATED 1 n=1 Tax=Henckelia pumila TaxID=405737 RepID=UPI003C6DF27C